MTPTPNPINEAEGFIADYLYEPEDDDSSALKEVFRAARIMRALLDEYRAHVAYLEGELRQMHALASCGHWSTTDCQTDNAERLRWPRPDNTATPSATPSATPTAITQNTLTFYEESTMEEKLQAIWYGGPVKTTITFSDGTSLDAVAHLATQPKPESKP